ncbi:MAG: oligosaccharide flippase family protein [Pseudidiomarina maritima]|nr:oligosaccharide flippase family protein [Pseudidiomarina maritima]
MPLRYVQQVWRSKLARSVALVASGTAAAQVIGIAFSPIITRLYGPEAFGILGTYTALLTILTPIGALSYPIAIVLPKHDADAKVLVRLSIRLSFITSAIVGLLLLIAERPLLELLNIGEVGKFIWFVPLAMLLSVWLAVATNWAVRKKLFQLTAKVAVINALIQNGLKAAIGLFAPFAWVLISVATLGNAMNAALYYFGIRKQPHQELSYEYKSLTQMELAKNYGDFAYYRTPQIVLNAASQSMPVLMLTALFGPAAAGFYSLGRMVLGVPGHLLGQSVSTVFYPHFSEVVLAKRSGATLLLKTTLGLFFIGIIPFLIVILCGPFIFKFTFGNEWHKAGELARWLSIWLLFSLAARPAIAAIPVLKMQKAFLFFEMFAVMFRAGALYLAYYFYNSLESAVIGFSLISVGVYLFLIAWVFKRCSKKANLKILET